MSSNINATKMNSTKFRLHTLHIDQILIKRIMVYILKIMYGINVFVPVSCIMVHLCIYACFLILRVQLCCKHFVLLN